VSTGYVLVATGPDLALFSGSDPSYNGYFVVGSTISAAPVRYVYARATSLRRAKHFARQLLLTGSPSGALNLQIYWLPRELPRVLYQVTGLRIPGLP
jgi:hypothetical protein